MGPVVRECTHLFGCTMPGYDEYALELGLAAASPPPIPSRCNVEEREILSLSEPAWVIFFGGSLAH